jgi:hypothetical protein
MLKLLPIVFYLIMNYEKIKNRYQYKINKIKRYPRVVGNLYEVIHMKDCGE